MAVTPPNDLRHTPLFSLHGELNARMVDFAGYSLPVQYEGVKAEHLHTRAAAGLFDVSHMGQVLIQGEQVAEKLEALVPIDLVDLPINKQIYALFTNDRGGILDDLLICRWADEVFLLVVNAACKQADLAWLEENLQGVDIQLQDDKALVAFQGPAAADVMAQVIPESRSLTFMTGCHANAMSNTWITRSGYTGEDGFEVSLPAVQAENFCRQLLDYDQVRPVGLGARDTLRLEAGLCLYGHDLDNTVTPVAANLQWSISKARRPGGARSGGFPGAERILEELTTGTQDKRVGLKALGRAPVREGAELVDENHSRIGHVTSGGFGPSVNTPVAMGYVQRGYAKPGTVINAMVRGKPVPVAVVDLPFVPSNYVR